MEKNPFKFGSIVDEPYYTDRKEELKKVLSVLNSENHLVLISPRRYGKTSLIDKATRLSERPVINIDLQLITSVTDLATQILRRVYRLHPFEKVRQFVRHFRVIPTVSVNPVTNAVDVSFVPDGLHSPVLEDVLNLVESLSNNKNKTIVVFDEFQEAKQIDAGLLKFLRAIMQHHKKINYVFLGSQESLIRDIFEKKKSPFYHFGQLMTLEKIPYDDFFLYLQHGLNLPGKKKQDIANEILSITDCHPYYTQMLAFVVWNNLLRSVKPEKAVIDAILEILQMNDIHYERLWNNLNKTDKKLLFGLVVLTESPLSEAFYRKSNLSAPSTVFSCLKRLMTNGILIKSGSVYEIDDPFFKRWLQNKLKA